MIIELKKMGIELDMPANKLKTGHGEGVCSVLTKLCTVSLAAKFKFKKAVIKDEGGRDMEEEGDDDGGDMEGNADIADMLLGGNNSDDDIEDFTEFGGGDKNDAAINLENQII